MHSLLLESLYHANVTSEKIASRPVVNVMDALQGQVAGLQVFTSSGDPGDKSMAASSYLRGIGSLTAGNAMVRLRLIWASTVAVSVPVSTVKGV